MDGVIMFLSPSDGITPSSTIKPSCFMFNLVCYSSVFKLWLVSAQSLHFIPKSPFRSSIQVAVIRLLYMLYCMCQDYNVLLFAWKLHMVETRSRLTKPALQPQHSNCSPALWSPVHILSPAAWFPRNVKESGNSFAAFVVTKVPRLSAAKHGTAWLSCSCNNQILACILK